MSATAKRNLSERGNSMPKLYRAALYMRLSKDDDGASESASIATQRKMLRAYAQENGYIVADEYIEACDILEPTQRIQQNQGFKGWSNFFQSISHSRGLCRAT